MKKATDPKSIKSAFIFYCQETRPDLEQAYPGYDETSITKKLHKSWLQLSSSDRMRFIKLAEEDKNRYYKEQDEVRGFRAELESKKTWDPKAPRRNKPAFMFYCAEKRSEVQKMYSKSTPWEVTKILSEMWSSLPQENREPYEKEAEKDQDRYEREKQQYDCKPLEEEIKLELQPKSKKKKSQPEPEHKVKTTPAGFDYFVGIKQESISDTFPELKEHQVDKMLKAMWLDLPVDSKKLYAALDDHQQQIKPLAKKRKRHWDTG